LNNPTIISPNYQFGKSYKLCAEIIIQKVYNDGIEIKQFPFLLKYLTVALPQKTSAFQIVLVAPKKKFKHAVLRNQIKRYMREVIRQNKYELEATLNKQKQQVAIFLMYNGSINFRYKDFDSKINVLLKRLVKDLEQ
jgi:ribonuclease P protein component